MNMKKWFIIGMFILSVGLCVFNVFERSGCCSHHGGVCGCSAGRARCCDGTLSPSCGCY